MPDQEQQPITRDDLNNGLNQLKAELKEFVKDSQAEIIAQILAQTQEFVRDAQTEILRGFLNFEGSREIRFSHLKTKVANLDTEVSGQLANFEKRLMEIEAKLILYPPKHQ